MKQTSLIHGKTTRHQRIGVCIALEQQQFLDQEPMEEIMRQIAQFFKLKKKLSVSKHKNKNYWII